MAIRKTTHVLKNSDIVNRPLPSSLKAGEPIVNTAEGIMYFTGVTSSTDEWTPAGTGTTANFFEVGSNLYDLRLRNQITEYQGASGAGLVGKFLSGTTSGFVLADISSISGDDSFLTGGTYNGTNLVLNLNNGQPSVTVTGITDTNTNDYTTSATLIGSVAYFNRTDAASAYTLDLSTFVSTGDTYVTGFTYDGANNLTVGRNNGQVNLSVNISTMTGLTVNGAISATSIDAATIFSGGTDLATLIGDTNTFITGGTVSYAGAAGTLTLTDNEGTPITVNGFTDDYTTGSTLVGNTLYFDKLTSLSAYSADLSALSTVDTYVTGVTYNNSLLTISRNEGQPALTAIVDEVSGLTVNNLTAGRVVYVGTGGLLTDEAGFTYNASTNTLSSATDGTMNVGTGGLNVDGDTVIQGNLTVFGSSISAFTSDLYIEDNNVHLNYNPTGDTSSTSLGAGWTIQDGSGVVSEDVNLDIQRMDTFTGLTATEIPDISEYTGGTGYENRAWVTQLNDIVIRSTEVGTPNGVRVLAEFDCLDGGTF